MNIITFYETEEEAERGDCVAESSMVQYCYSRLHKEIIYKRNAEGSPISIKNYRRAEVHHNDNGFTHIRVVLGGKYEEA